MKGELIRESAQNYYKTQELSMLIVDKITINNLSLAQNKIQTWHELSSRADGFCFISELEKAQSTAIYANF